MTQNLLVVGQTVQHYNVSGTRILKYSLEMHHDGLKEHKVLTAPEHDILVTKAKLQAGKWAERWAEVERKRVDREERAASAEEAAQRTREAEEAIIQIETILNKTLSVNDAIDWDSLKTHAQYEEKKPVKPRSPTADDVPPPPDRESSAYRPKFTIFDQLFKSLKQKKRQQVADSFAADTAQWETSRKEVEDRNAQWEREYRTSVELWERQVKEWENRKGAFEQEQLRFNSHIDEMHALHAEHSTDAVEQYCEMVLNNSKYPEAFPKDFEVQYSPETKILVVEYMLPTPEAMPRIKEVKYLSTKGQMKETYLPEAQVQKMFDDAVYQIILRTIHELFEADVVEAIDAISFNGWVHFVNKATGKDEDACIASIQVRRHEFNELDLSRIDPKACFKTLKGVGSSKLYGITAIQPILQIDKTDRRFVEAREVVDKLNAGTNIAAMDWEEFEHLIRELFEKEFSTNGGEVKITQASRDGGVDAVAFDPDPIRGGKIVIQAKRYTNTVGVSAVRDLYGTLINEGATKGILVTTADYGPDAYEFAKGKPLTLLNGSNLLSLLEKHGHRVRIDIAEARSIARDETT